MSAMWRLGFVLILVSFSSFASTKDCKVYGISDSPQTLTCTFPDLSLKLTCHEGIYALNEETVTMAFHMEVEDGPTPLVFKSSSMQLTATKLPSQKFLGELDVNSQTLQGSCE
jgi:hypothetical protein